MRCRINFGGAFSSLSREHALLKTVVGSQNVERTARHEQVFAQVANAHVSRLEAATMWPSRCAATGWWAVHHGTAQARLDGSVAKNVGWRESRSGELLG